MSLSRPRLRACRKQVSCPGYVAHELSGFMPPVREALDEPDDMATGPQDAEVSGRFEPLGAQGAVGDGGRRAFGILGAAVPALPPALRGGWACRAGRSPARQGVAASGAGGQAGVDAGRIPHASPGLEREAFSRAHPAAAWVLVERAARRGAHRRKRPRKPCEGMMLHQDGSRFAWLSGSPELDLIVTMDDA